MSDDSLLAQPGAPAQPAAPAHPAGSSLRQVIETLLAGKPALFPTDTVYGLGVAVFAAKTPQALYAIKHRDLEKAIPLLVSSPQDLDTYGTHIPEYAYDLAQQYWPGALTLIVPASAALPEAYCGPEHTVALRMPGDPVALEILRGVGGPVATSSANLQGMQPPQAFDQVDPEVIAAVSAYCYDEAPRSGVSSTIVDCTGGAPRVLRQGSVRVD
ncbi:MAG: L-threonylcarbamoyladenylate synthase [Eggerthellales bacterium]|nr:L-threonylcarbamoyladenylate synthase [Eggerthellales bacterium]